MAVLEVCGFNDWLIRLLQDYRCHRVILIQPDDRKKCKTDRRDAAALSELLWANRDRLLHGKPVRGLRQVELATAATRRTGGWGCPGPGHRSADPVRRRQQLKRYPSAGLLAPLTSRGVGAEGRGPPPLLVLVGDRLCWLGGPAVAVDTRGGRTLGKEGLDGPANEYSSPLAAGGRIALFTRAGGAYVLRADDLRIPARNYLGDDSGIVASPALSGRPLFIRSNRHLYCIGRDPEAGLGALPLPSTASGGSD